MRVSPITLVIFIVLIVFCIMFSYIFYSSKGSELELLADVNTKLDLKNEAYRNQVKDRDDLLAATGYNPAGLMTVTGSNDVNQPAQTLDALFTQKVAVRDELVKEIGLQITDVDASGNSLYLERTIDDAVLGETPDSLRDTLVGQIIEALRAARKARADHDQVIARGQQTVSALNTSIQQKEDETKTTIAAWDEKIKSAWDARVAARDKLIEDRKAWQVEEVELTQRDSVAQAILTKVNVQKATQEDMASPADGKILTYDWKTKRGVIDLGAHDGVKAGYEFDVYHRHPGPDTADRRTYHGRITLIEVKPEVSIFAVVASPWDADEQPVRAGDLVTSRLFDTSPAKSFYIAGYFPRGSEYDRGSLAGLVRKYGGSVQEELTLQTDYVVVGIVSAEGLPDLSEEAKKAVAKAKTDYELARRFNVTVLTVDKFLELIDRE